MAAIMWRKRVSVMESTISEWVIQRKVRLRVIHGGQGKFMILVAYLDGTPASCHLYQLKPFVENFIEISR